MTSKTHKVVRTYPNNCSQLSDYLNNGWVVVFSNKLSLGSTEIIEYILEKECKADYGFEAEY